MGLDNHLKDLANINHCMVTNLGHRDCSWLLLSEVVYFLVRVISEVIYTVGLVNQAW